MNALTPVASRASALASQAPDVPAMSRALMVDVARLTDPDPAARALRQFDPREISAAQRQEAGWMAERHRALLEEPVTRPQFVAWLGAVNAACRNPQGEADLRVRVQAIGQDCAHLPALCFTAESRRALYAETRFFPSAGDVLAVLEPIVTRMKGRLAALERIAAPVPAAPPQEPARRRSAEEVASVAAKVAGLKAELAARREVAEVGSEARPVTARHLSPGDYALVLQADIRRTGDPHGTLAYRLAALQRQRGIGPAVAAR